MSDADKLKKSIQEEIEVCSDFLDGAKAINEVAPFVQERKEDVEAKAEAVQSLPPDVLDELAPQMLKSQETERNRLSKALPVISKFEVRHVRAMLSSASTSTDAEVVISVVSAHPKYPLWAPSFMKPFERLAQKQERVSQIRQAVERLDRPLSELVDLAVNTVESARGGVAEVDHACVRLRDVIEAVWGKLATRARQECADIIRGRHLEFRRDASRRLAAECLSPTDEVVGDVNLLLEHLATLHGELSVSSKKPFLDDRTYLDTVYSRWVLHLFNLARALDL